MSDAPMTLSERAAQAREEADTEFRPRIERALSRWTVQISEVEIGGLSCQVIEPTDGNSCSTMLYFFGGGFVTGSPENDLPITAALSSLGSMRVIAPRYGLSPEHPFPIAIEQSFEVYRALIEKHPLTVCGESAGGGLALAVLQRAIDTNLPLPERIALPSPWCDLRDVAAAQSEDVDDPLLDAESLRFYAAAYLNGAPAQDPRASPILAPYNAEWPETLLTTGSRDRLRHKVHALAEKIGAGGGQCDVIDVPGMPHVFEAYDENPEALETLKRIAVFLQS